MFFHRFLSRCETSEYRFSESPNWLCSALMMLYLLRHAEAEDAAATDAARNLTARGVAQAAVVGEFCRRQIRSLEHIICSPAIRTMQTAEGVRATMKAGPVLPDRRLISGMQPETGLEVLRERASSEAILLVGHQPDLSLLAGYLLSRDGSCQLGFETATLLALDLCMVRRAAGKLQFFLPAELLRVV